VEVNQGVIVHVIDLNAPETIWAQIPLVRNLVKSQFTKYTNK